MRKRLIYRCDDVGYTLAYDLGLFRVIDAGIGCSADVMLDAEHVKEALEWIRERPWLSVGWHRHLWERPVLPPEEVPSLVNEEGRFKWGHRRQDLMAEATYEDAYREFKAEAELCNSILGRYPDVASVREDSDLPLEKAFKDVVEECGIVHNYYTTTGRTPAKKPREGMERRFPRPEGDEKYKDLHIVSDMSAVSSSYKMEDWNDYNPIENLTHPCWTEDEEIFFYGWHPGYVDDHILAESTCNIHRVRELQHALSKEFAEWIMENHVELVNFRDALYGTNEMQDHLKEINSPLWIGNMK